MVVNSLQNMPFNTFFGCCRCSCCLQIFIRCNKIWVLWDICIIIGRKVGHARVIVECSVLKAANAFQLRPNLIPFNCVHSRFSQTELIAISDFCWIWRMNLPYIREPLWTGGVSAPTCVCVCYMYILIEWALFIGVSLQIQNPPAEPLLNTCI